MCRYTAFQCEPGADGVVCQHAERSVPSAFTVPPLSCSKCISSRGRHQLGSMITWPRQWPILLSLTYSQWPRRRDSRSSSRGRLISQQNLASILSKVFFLRGDTIFCVPGWKSKEKDIGRTKLHDRHKQVLSEERA